MTVLFAGLDRIITDVAQFPAAVPVTLDRLGTTSGPGPLSDGGGGSFPSDQWLHQLARCESGDPPVSPWRTGWFGIEAGYAIGSLSWDAQVAWVRRILAGPGPGAWSSYRNGCVGAPY